MRLPVAADFVIEQMIGGEVGPLGVGIFLHDLAHDLFFHLGAHIGVLFFGGGQRLDIGILDLPADIPRAIEGFGGQRRVGKILGHAGVEAHGIVGGATASARAGGLVLVLGRRTE